MQMCNIYVYRLDIRNYSTQTRSRSVQHAVVLNSRQKQSLIKCQRASTVCLRISSVCPTISAISFCTFEYACNYWFFFKFSATIAARAIELTFVSNVSERDVRMTGACVPVKILPFLTGTICTIALYTRFPAWMSGNRRISASPTILRSSAPFSAAAYL